MRSIPFVWKGSVLRLWLLTTVSACNSDPCVQVDPTCAPLYAPVFDEVHSRTLEPSCALSGCHNASSQAGELDLSTPDGAYAALVDDGRVLPGDPDCSLLISRLESTDEDKLMPRGMALDNAERCAIIQWVNQGATR